MSASITGLTVTFDGSPAVDDLTLEISGGERFVVMGPSGSGKSTLLRAIAGLESLESGRIVLDGTDVTALPTHRRPLGLMFQEYALFPHMSVVENVAYGLRMHGMARAAAHRRATEILDIVGLGGFATRKPTSLSGGERQRVALARTLAPEPTLVMLDEPLGSLDLSLRELLLAEMRSVLERVGATSLYVTHDRTEAFAFADRLAIMREGSIIRIGTPAAIWNDPGTTFVARFIGHPNVVAGQHLGFAGTAVTIPIDAVSIDPDGRFPGSVTDVVFSDGTYEMTVDVGGSTALRVASSRPHDRGAQVRLHIDPSGVQELVVDEL